jgi:hypothetical protein
MARDRVVCWKEKPPTQEDLQALLEKFFSGLTMSVTWDRDRFFVVLLGAPSYCSGVGAQKERWIEVWPSKDGTCCYVMTRMQDEATNVLADGLAGLIARRWEGRLEQ